MAIHERSAGVIVYRTVHSVRKYLLLDYGRYWDYPKGHVEKDEDDRTAALRELAEETGITDVNLRDDFSHEMAYFFRSKRGLIRKTVHFFLGEVDTERIRLSEEHVGYDWLEYQAALDRLGFASARQVLEAAERALTAP